MEQTFEPILLFPNGKYTFVQPKDKKTFTIGELQSMVGGYFEFVSLPTGSMLVVNEDGKSKRLPLNRQATKLAAKALGEDDVIVGTALYCPANLIK